MRNASLYSPQQYTLYTTYPGQIQGSRALVSGIQRLPCFGARALVLLSGDRVFGLRVQNPRSSFPNRGTPIWTQNTLILIIGAPQKGTPNFGKTPKKRSRLFAELGIQD